MDKNKDLFGEEVVVDFLLRDKFIEPPFSILDTRGGAWQNRKRKWKNLGMKSEVGREKSMTHTIPLKAYDKNNMEETFYSDKAQELNTSIFDPALCELLYHWFCPEGGTVIDPFAGGSVRGIVANKLGFKYTGIEIREEQVLSNIEQGITILGKENSPNWICGDSNEELDKIQEKFDFVLSCPPYADLEVYSTLEGDISNMPYNKFLEIYESIILKSCLLLKKNGFACFVVGEVRDKNGFYLGFVPDTIKAFEKAGMRFYNEGILLNAVGSASMRADKQFSAGKKLVKIHQNVLIFKKP